MGSIGNQVGGVLSSQTLLRPPVKPGRAVSGSLAAHPGRDGRGPPCASLTPGACLMALAQPRDHWRLLCASVFSGVRVKEAAGQHALRSMPSRSGRTFGLHLCLRMAKNSNRVVYR